MIVQPFPSPGDVIDVADYCRRIETYLCQKNDGHLIRVVGPSFEVVSRWASEGVPLKVAFGGIDRSVERYYRLGPRRRPLRIEFCDADVRDVFDDWRRATGLVASTGPEAPQTTGRRQGASLPEHLQRVIVRLTNARVHGVIGPMADGLMDRLSHELDLARASSAGLRGETRKALIARLAEADAELATIVREALDPAALDLLARAANDEIAAFREGMSADAFALAKARAIDRLARERLGLPTIAFL